MVRRSRTGRTRKPDVPEWEKVYQNETQERRLLYQARVLGWGKEKRYTSRTRDFERNRLWVLKNSHYRGKRQNSGDPKCLGIREDRLERILTRFYFCDFRAKEFFNTHACLQEPNLELRLRSRKVLV
jgi:hypothetical protein